MLLKSQIKNFHLGRALIFFPTLGIYCEANEIYNSKADNRYFLTMNQVFYIPYILYSWLILQYH